MISLDIALINYSPLLSSTIRRLWRSLRLTQSREKSPLPVLTINLSEAPPSPRVLHPAAPAPPAPPVPPVLNFRCTHLYCVCVCVCVCVCMHVCRFVCLYACVCSLQLYRPECNMCLLWGSAGQVLIKMRYTY